MSEKTIKTNLTRSKTCKHSVVYKAVDVDPIITSLYIMNKGVEMLGNPTNIFVAISINEIAEKGKA